MGPPRPRSRHRWGRPTGGSCPATRARTPSPGCRGSRTAEPWLSHQVADAGDLGVNPFSLAEAISQIDAGARAALSAADHLIAVGGDHTIALPLLRATAARHGPVALVHFDAHLD